MAIMSKAMASGTARAMDRIQIRAISMAIHLGTPMPLMRLHDATARYLVWGEEVIVGPCYHSASWELEFVCCITSRLLFGFELGTCVSQLVEKGINTARVLGLIPPCIPMLRLDVKKASVCLPVDTQSTETEHCDPNGGLLDEGHQLAESHSEGPVLCQQLGGNAQP